jgi:hypothetical protein
MVSRSKQMTTTTTAQSVVTAGHLYLLREREFVNTNQPIYKIGKTRQENGKRFGGYSKDTVIEFMLRVADSDAAETEAKRKFDQLFKKRTEIGSESYEGDRVTMLTELAKFIAPIEAKVAPPIDYEPMIKSLEAAFYPIYYGFHSNLSFTFMEHTMRQLHVIHCINRVYESGGRPAIRPEEKSVAISIAKFMKDMTKSYGKPTITRPVSAEQYQKFVGTNNTLARLAPHFANYEQQRAKLPPAMAVRYFAFELTHLVEIDAIAFNQSRLKCHDFVQNGAHWKTYPS